MWVQVAQSTDPYPVVSAMMAYDPDVNGTVMFGGFRPAPYYAPSGDTWEYSNEQWANLTSVVGPSPPPRTDGMLAYEPADHELVLFGGQSAGGARLNDTWTFAKDRWTQIAPTVAPSAREGASLAWDPVASDLVLFGGLDTTGAYLNDTWTFVHGSWSALGINGPAPRAFAGLAADPTSTGLVLFGGRTTASSQPFADTYRFTAGGWTRLSPAVSPVGRANPEMVLDPELGSVFLFGGFNGTGGGNVYYADTWTFNGTDWGLLHPSGAPTARGAAGVAFDSHDGYVVLYGGAGATADLSDSWVYDSLWANATVGPLAGAAPLHLTGTAVPHGGRSPYSVDWTYGDGTASVGPGADHLFPFDGVFRVNASVVDGFGVASTEAFVVNVTGPLAVAVAANRTSGPAPLAVAFSSTVTGGYAPFRRNWSFGDGNGSSAAAPVHGFANPGSYLAQLTVTDAHGSMRSASVAINVTYLPLEIRLVWAQPSASDPLLFSFSGIVGGGRPPYTFQWGFGDGTEATTNPANHTYGAPGRFAVTLNVTDARGVSLATESVLTVAPGRSSPAAASCWGGGPCSVLGLSTVGAGVVASGLAVGALLAWVGVRRRRGPRSRSPSPIGEGQLPGAPLDGPGEGVGAIPEGAQPGTPLESAPGSVVDLAGSSGPPQARAAVHTPPAPGVPFETPRSVTAPTLSDQILLHLSHQPGADPNAPAPASVTQDGLAAALGRPQGAFARSLQRLEAAGLIVSETAHVTGRRRRVKAYHLTARGESAARRLHSSERGDTE